MKDCIYNFIFYIYNHFINRIPSYKFRHIFYKLLGIKIGKNSSIKLGVYIENRNIEIKDNVSIGRNSYLDGRGNIIINKNVSISPNVSIITGTHDINSKEFSYKKTTVEIDEYVWIGTGAIILGDIIIGEGAVVAAGAVVVNNVEPYTIVGGVPAKKIGNRSKDLDYLIKWQPPFN